MSPTADRRVNVLDETQLNDAVEQFEPTTVIHCAGVVKFRRAGRRDASKSERARHEERALVDTFRPQRETLGVLASTVTGKGRRDDDDDDDGQKPLLTEENFSVRRTLERNPYAVETRRTRTRFAVSKGQ